MTQIPASNENLFTVGVVWYQCFLC